MNRAGSFTVRITMLNHEGSHPEYFEELCALAASGQISEPEFMELQDHLRQCEECRSAYADFIDLLHSKLPLVDPALAGTSKLSGFFSENSTCRERFFARARKEGVTLSEEPPRDNAMNQLRSWFWPGLGHAQLATLAVAVLLVTVGLLSYSLYQDNLRYRKLASDQAALSKRLSQQSGGTGSTREESYSSSLPPLETVPTEGAPAPAGPETESKLAKVRTEQAAAEARSKGLEDQLAKVA